MNLLKLMTVNNPQAHSVVPGILRRSVWVAALGHGSPINAISLQHFYEALQREDGLNILGQLYLSDDLLDFFWIIWHL